MTEVEPVLEWGLNVVLVQVFHDTTGSFLMDVIH